MSQSHPPQTEEQREIQKLRGLLRSKEEDLSRARQEISQLQGGGDYQYQQHESSSPGSLAPRGLMGLASSPSCAGQHVPGPFEQDGLPSSNMLPRSASHGAPLQQRSSGRSVSTRFFHRVPTKPVLTRHSTNGDSTTSPAP